MSRLIHAQVVLQGQSGLAEDVYVNNFWFLRALEDAGQDDEIAQNLKDFYDTPTTGGTSIRDWLSPTVATNGQRTKLYDWNQPKPRVPVYESTWNFSTTPGVSAMPSEVALCLSGRGAKVSGTNDARRRGRVYIGPLAFGTVEEDAFDNARPKALVRTCLLQAGTRLAADMNSDGWLWGVHSSVGPAGNFIQYSQLWVDDAFDTQRRRGKPAALKDVQALSQLALAV